MDLPEYISADEVKRVCQELGFRDWAELEEPAVTEDEAQKLLDLVNAKGLDVSLEAFRVGLEVELEHGTRFHEANVTNNHPVVTARIVLAHLNEMLDYYERLEVAELEGDLLKALRSGNLDKARDKFAELAKARQRLDDVVRASLNQ